MPCPRLDKILVFYMTTSHGIQFINPRNSSKKFHVSKVRAQNKASPETNNISTMWSVDISYLLEKDIHAANSMSKHAYIYMCTYVHAYTSNPP